jgi:hypothetical protein
MMNEASIEQRKGLRPLWELANYFNGEETEDKQKSNGSLSFLGKANLQAHSMPSGEADKLQYPGFRRGGLFGCLGV